MRRAALLLSLVLGACSAVEVDYREAPLCEVKALCPDLEDWCTSIADDAGALCHELDALCDQGDAAEVCAWAMKACAWSGDCSLVDPVCKPCV